MFSPSKSRSKPMNTTRDVLSFFGWISALVSSTSLLVVSISLVSRVLLWVAIVYLKWLCYTVVQVVATKPCHQNQPCSHYLYRYSQHITGYDPVLTTCLPIPSYTAICALYVVWYLSTIYLHLHLVTTHLHTCHCLLWFYPLSMPCLCLYLPTPVWYPGLAITYHLGSLSCNTCVQGVHSRDMRTWDWL